MNKRLFLFFGIVLLSITTVYYLSTVNSTNTNVNIPPQRGSSDIAEVTQIPAVTEGVTATPETVVKIFNIEVKPFSFTPNEIRVKTGDTVRIILRNSEGMHDFVIDEFNARTKQIQAGQTDTIEFTVNRQGTFEYYCSVGNHRQMGMVGNLVVE